MILPKIQVVWVSNPKLDELSHYDKIPILLIDDKIVELCKFYGERYKYFGEKFIIKIDASIDPNCEYYCNQAEHEVNIWKSLEPEDRKYFPELLAYDLENKWVCNPIININESPNPTKKEIKFLKKLIKKYNIEDVSVDPAVNWGVDIDTKLPIIYDYGA